MNSTSSHKPIQLATSFAIERVKESLRQYLAREVVVSQRPSTRTQGTPGQKTYPSVSTTKPYWASSGRRTAGSMPTIFLIFASVTILGIGWPMIRFLLYTISPRK